MKIGVTMAFNHLTDPEFIAAAAQLEEVAATAVPTKRKETSSVPWHPGHLLYSYVYV